MSHKNYNKMSQPKVTPNEEISLMGVQRVETTPTPATVTYTNEPEVILLKGVVSNCTKLNLRAEPNSDAEVLCELPCNTEVEVDKAASTEKFYKVCTATGMEGYCMKDYIVV